MVPAEQNNSVESAADAHEPQAPPTPTAPALDIPKPQFPRPGALERIAGLTSVALLAGLLNVAVSIYLERPPELEAAAVLVQVAAFSVIFCLPLYGFVWLGLTALSTVLRTVMSTARSTSVLSSSALCLLVARHGAGFQAPATSLVVVTLGLLTPFALLADRGGWQQDLVRFGFLGLTGAVAAGLGCLVSSARSEEAGDRGGVRALLMAAPLLGSLILLATWWTTFAAALSSAENLLLWGAAVVVMAVVGGACWALRDAVSIEWFVSGYTALLLIAGSLILWWANAPLEIPSFDDLSGERPRHLVLLTVDTLRADAIGPRAGVASSTPNLDALSADSIVFENARSPAPWTKPAVISMLTGLSPLVHEIMRGPTRVPDELLTLPEFLQAAGYRTGAVGENPFLHARYNFDQGFERYRMFPKMLGRSFGGRIVRYLGMAYPSTADLTDIAIDWVQSSADDPFFLWLHYFDPHPPYSPPVEYLTGSGPESIGKSFRDTSGVRAGAVSLDAAERAWIEELYMAEVRYVDENVGRFLEYLKAAGIYDDSLIIFSSDHGEEFWEHGGFEHGHSLYDEVIRVPLMLKLPGQAATGRQSSNVSTESIPPTILDLLDIEAGDAIFSAASLSQAWQVEGYTSTTPIVSTGLRYFEDRISTVRGPMKNIHWLVSGSDELFDLDKDPDEKISLAGDHPELVDEAYRLLASHRTLSLQIRQLLGLPTSGQGVLDPAVLEQLRSLGYIQ